MHRYLDHPVVRYVVIIVTGIIASVIFFKIGAVWLNFQIDARLE